MRNRDVPPKSGNLATLADKNDSSNFDDFWDGDGWDLGEDTFRDPDPGLTRIKPRGAASYMNLFDCNHSGYIV